MWLHTVIYFRGIKCSLKLPSVSTSQTHTVPLKMYVVPNSVYLSKTTFALHISRYSVSSYEICWAATPPVSKSTELTFGSVWLQPDRHSTCSSSSFWISMEISLCHSENPLSYLIGRQGHCQHYPCYLSCSAASCLSCDKRRVFSEHGKILESIWTSAHCSASLTASNVHCCQSGAQQACL